MTDLRRHPGRSAEHSAEFIARALGGRKVGSGWMARCPSHDDRQPSLSIRDVDGKVLVYCHAGCHQLDVIAALRERGLWEARTPRLFSIPSRRPAAGDYRDENQAARTAAALAIWKSSIPANGTLVEIYLAARSLTLPIPPTIRFDVVVLADGDEAGEAAAQDCALRWKREGRGVRVARPPLGMDFNDVLLGRAPRIERACHD